MSCVESVQRTPCVCKHDMACMPTRLMRVLATWLYSSTQVGQQVKTRHPTPACKAGNEANSEHGVPINHRVLNDLPARPTTQVTLLVMVASDVTHT
jgi:hypothetical protein